MVTYREFTVSPSGPEKPPAPETGPTRLVWRTPSTG